MKFKSPEIHRSPLYRAKSTWRLLQQRCGNSNGKSPAYVNVELRMTEAEFFVWAIPRYAAFAVEHPEESPVVSRVGDSGHYQLDNIELISALENRLRQRKPMQIQVDGTKVCSRCRRKLVAIEKFNHRKDSLDGFNHHCQECQTFYRQQDAHEQT